jgi:hypothetical protein
MIIIDSLIKNRSDNKIQKKVQVRNFTELSSNNQKIYIVDKI